MRYATFALYAACGFVCSGIIFGQDPVNQRSAFHAGIHSGSWTLKRSQLLEKEKQDVYRSCSDPYCARCAEHLADYGHEYQYLSGPRQHQLWYPGTLGNVAVTVQRGYDQHGIPYRRRGQPAAVVSKEYVQTLNHAIWEQVNARNAVAAEDAAKDRVDLLADLLQSAREQLRLTTEAWEKMQNDGYCCIKNISAEIHSVPVCAKTYTQFCSEMHAGEYESAQTGICNYCLAKCRYQFDKSYTADVESELAKAERTWNRAQTVANESVRIALLSKEDADKATRFKRIQFKPPKVKKKNAAEGFAAEREKEPAAE